MTSTKRNVNDLVMPPGRDDPLWQLVKHAGQRKPLFNRSDMQEPLYTMILTAFFAVILLVIGSIFVEIASLILVLMALVSAWFGLEWHNWLMMRRLNTAAREAAMIDAYEWRMNLKRRAENRKRLEEVAAEPQRKIADYQRELQRLRKLSIHDLQPPAKH